MSEQNEILTVMTEEKQALTKEVILKKHEELVNWWKI